MSASQRVSAIVPMRHSSERVPGKNYRLLGGRPLFHWVVRSLLDTPSVAEVIVDTDSDYIIDSVQANFGAVRVVLRPEHLRDGHTPMNDVLLNTALYASEETLLQTHSTNPFVRPGTFESAIEAYFNSPERDSAFGVTRIQGRLWSQDVAPINHDPQVLARTQDLDPVYFENSCFYIFAAERLRQTGNRLGSSPAAIEVPTLEAIDIDEESDFQLAEAIEAAHIFDERP